MYEYLDRKPEAGDIVECQTDVVTSFTKSNLYICKEVANHLLVELDDKNSTGNGAHPKHFKVVKTLPGDAAKVDDTCILINNNFSTDSDRPKLGIIFKVTEILKDKDNSIIVLPDIYSQNQDFEWAIDADCVRVLCLAETKPKAYYKRSGEPWTPIELQTIPTIWHPQIKLDNTAYKWLYPTTSGRHEYYLWESQRPARYPQEYTLVAFEDEFNISSLGAQSEPTQSIIKESTMNFQELINSIFQDKIQTDYDKKPDYLVVIYNNEGTEIAQATAGSIQSVEDKIQATPKLWGAKAVCYKIDTEVQTQVPVTSTKLKKSK